MNTAHNLAADTPQTDIQGVFSTEVPAWVGSGATRQRTTRKVYVYAQQLDAEAVELQRLNVNQVPAGNKQELSLDEFLSDYAPEPEFYISTVYPRMRAMQEHVERGEEHRGKGESFSAQLEFESALKVDEDHVRANFGLGLTFLARGDNAKANDIFRRLVDLEAAFEPVHKHLFNEFGIRLRKCGMYDQALEYYARALDFAKRDEHLLLNIARAHYERGDIDNCKNQLLQAVEINSAFAEGRQFLTFLSTRGYILPQEMPNLPEMPDMSAMDAGDILAGEGLDCETSFLDGPAGDLDPEGFGGLEGFSLDDAPGELDGNGDLDDSYYKWGGDRIKAR